MRVSLFHLKIESFQNRKDRDRFVSSCMSSISCIRRLKHPHVLTIYEVNEDLKTFGFSAEPVDAVISQANNFSEDEILYISDQVMKTLQFLHTEAKVLYLGLDLDSVCLTRDLNVKLFGFNYATSFSELPVRPSYGNYELKFGQPSLSFTAPEYFMNQNVDYCADVYSFGCFVASLFNRKEIFNYDSIETFISDEALGKIKLPDGLPNDMCDIISRCIDFQKRKRPTFDEIATSSWFSQLSLKSLNYIDISKSQINNETFGSFLKVVFGKPRKHLIALNLSELATSSSMDDIIKCLDIKNPEPILSELNFFGNNLSPDNALNLFKFLRTQKHFQYLNISRCFNTDIPESLSHLSNYINESKLKCLELSCSTNNPLKEHTEKFFQDLTGKCQLSTITMERTQMGDKGLLALLELIKADKYISSISIDGALPETPEVFEKVYNSFISLERLASPKVDFTKHKKSVNLSRDLGKKQNPKNLVSRLNEYDLIELNSSPSIVDKLIDFTKSISDHKKSKHKRNYEEIINVINETIKLTNFPLQGNESSNPFIDNYLLKKHSSKS